MAGRRVDVVLDTTARSLLRGLSGGDGRAAKSNTEDEKGAASLKEWQERYAEGSAGDITKCFFPRVEQRYRVLRKIEMTSQMAQTHGGFAQYLHRFELKDSPYCACDPAKIQDVVHVLEECPMFLRERVALETEIGVIVGGRDFPATIDDDKTRDKFFGFCNKMSLQLYQVDYKSYLLDFKSLSGEREEGDDDSSASQSSGAPTPSVTPTPGEQSPSPQFQGHHTMEFFEMCAALIIQLAQ
ncbi:5'-AMP-activated protein kinase catalytic subunit alpha-1 [Eumeta japonica]|uniref:5'-AMP-activated protein kinase catalytic subunit alpha-1 n=1 Tax=Eumeta variegata TaxID=151549 RepID=A0A4C1VT38_EUMVA|nr:5'-AMP-activated protein kinase catalytic subunit alpha-1 [Eumeta japonica]